MKKNETDMAELVVKIQQQLVSLERKIDTLISRPSDRPFEGKQKQERDHRERAMYKAICADCSKECEVPFRPNQDRPVYCRECFSRRKTGGPFKTNRDNKPQERDTARERPFAKYQRGENRRLAGKKKPSPKRRKK